MKEKEDKWKRVCLICHAVWGNPKGKHIYTFCKECLKKVKEEK